MRINLLKLILTVVMGSLIIIISDPMMKVLLERFYPEPPAIFSNFSAMHGLRIFWKMTEAHQAPIVFTGSSTTFAGISPLLFDKHIHDLTGKSVNSVNVSLTGQKTFQARDMIRDLFIPAGTSTVFYMTEIGAFSEGPGIQEYKDSPLGYTMQMAPGLPKTMGLWLLQHSAYVQYRNNLHDLITGRRTLQSPFDNYDFIDERGYTRWIGTVKLPKEIPPITPIIQEPYIQAFHDIALQCQHSRTRCIIVFLPIHREAYTVIPPNALLQFTARLQAAVQSTDTVFWNFNTQACTAALGDQAFYDLNHLNSEGSTAFTLMLADAYMNHFMGTPLSAGSLAQCAKLS
jgi:hypothetical protein